MTKSVVFVGTSREDLRLFPEQARRAAGHQLRRVQGGLVPDDWKPMPSVSPGACEIRVRDPSGAFRVIYVASLSEAIYVLHAFQKKTRKTPVRDLRLSRQRYGEVIRSRR